MTGTDKFWLNWAFEDYLKGPVADLLSIGCGDGAHELIIARNGYAQRIDAFDASSVGIDQAQRKVQNENLTGMNFYVDSFDNFCSRPPAKKYDLIMFAGSLHHVTHLETMLSTVSGLLKDNGRVMYTQLMPVFRFLTDRRFRNFQPAMNAVLIGVAADC